MKKSAYFFMALAALLLSGTTVSADVNATGLWSYSEPFDNDDCSFEYTPKTGQVVIIQFGDEFAIVSLEKTLVGTISEGKYSYTDTYYQHGGWFNVSADITFNSDNLGTGMAIWTWTDFVNPSCSGLYHITIIRIVPTAPTYDATGNWSYSYSTFSNDCGFANPIDSGTYKITQNGNLITLVDNQSEQLLLPIVGYVNGSIYNFVKIYEKTDGAKDGITGELFSVTLSSNKNGSGDCNWKWINSNNSSESCGGSWDVIIRAISNTMSSNSLLLLED